MLLGGCSYFLILYISHVIWKFNLHCNTIRNIFSLLLFSFLVFYDNFPTFSRFVIEMEEVVNINLKHEQVGDNTKTKDHAAEDVELVIAENVVVVLELSKVYKDKDKC